MPSLKAIRKRIGSVKNTQKITRAMKLVAAARLKRAADAIVAARPYAKALEDVIAEIAARAGREAHPLLAERPVERALVLVVTSDRGLAGGYNANVNRRVERFIAKNESAASRSTTLSVIGRKGDQYFRRRKVEVTQTIQGVAGDSALPRAKDLASTYVHAFLDGQVDAVFIAYNEFKSAMSQNVVVEQLLPIVPKALPAGTSPTDFEYEPSKEALLDAILPNYVELRLYKAFLESIASEFGARMSAMDAATKNASELISSLTLQYNRARQASITKELLEIIAGAESLKG